MSWTRYTTGILKLWRNSSGTISRLELMKAYVLFVKWIFFSLVVIARYLVCTLCSLNWLILYFSCSGSVLFGSYFVSHGLFCQWNWRCSFAGEILNKNINKPSTYAFRHLLTKVHSFLKDTVRANQPAKFFCCSLTGCLTLIVSLICT